jgi:hypothetical protein
MNYFSPIVPASLSDEDRSVDLVVAVPSADNDDDAKRFWSPSSCSSHLSIPPHSATEPVAAPVPSSTLSHLLVKDDIEHPNQRGASHFFATDHATNKTVDAAAVPTTLTKLEETPSIATRTTQNTSDPENPNSSKDASSSGTQTLDSTSVEDDDEEVQRCCRPSTTQSSYHAIHALFRHAHGTLRKTVYSRLSNALLVILYTNRCQILWQTWHLVTTLMIAGTHLLSVCQASFMEGTESTV